MNMRKKTFWVLIWTLALLVEAPSVFAARYDDPIILTLFFLLYSAFAWWFAAVMMIFGMTFLQGFILGFLVWMASFLYADHQQRTQRLREHPPATQEVPKSISYDPLRFMNLS